jgi:ataxin-3
MSTIIYHELQDSMLCGQHCLNNLLQDEFFSAVLLAEIAQELDDTERSIIDEGISPGKSANVDESGNFSIQVLRLALQVPYCRVRDSSLFSPISYTPLATPF